MPRAIWNGAVLAESDECELVEGNHYFPPDSVNHEYLLETTTTTVCPWKGTAHYCSVQVGDKVNEDAAWHYPSTKETAKHIEGYFAFWKGVSIEPR